MIAGVFLVYLLAFCLLETEAACHCHVANMALNMEPDFMSHCKSLLSTLKSQTGGVPQVQG